MAAPAIGANAVLVRGYFLQGFYPSGRERTADGFEPSGALVKAMLLHSSQRMATIVNDKGEAQELTEYPSPEQGYGRIQLDTVLHFSDAGRDPLSLFVIGAVDKNSPYYYVMTNTGDKVSYVVTTGTTSSSSTSSQLKVTLAYTDKPGVAGSGKVLVNDLDVSVTVQDGSYGSIVTYLPIPNSANSRIDNVEVIIIPNPRASTNYTITVSAYSLSCKQPFALVVTGHVSSYNMTEATPSALATWFTRIRNLDPEVKALISTLSVVLFILGGIVLSILYMNRSTYSELRNKASKNAHRKRWRGAGGVGGAA